ncbi:hypothetical protein A2U01_0084160, partial [Trifolium medium]|nr:hypothetical protein [Trifolium medium]
VARRGGGEVVASRRQPSPAVASWDVSP